MDIQDQKRALAKPQVAKLKALGEGMRVGVVWGRRLLIKPVVPFTDMDRLEKEGLIAVPKAVKEQNTPLPSTGIVVATGMGLDGDEHELFAPGTAVLYSKYAGSDFVIDRTDYKILHIDEIMATLEVDEAEVIVPLTDASD